VSSIEQQHRRPSTKGYLARVRAISPADPRCSVDAVRSTPMRNLPFMALALASSTCTRPPDGGNTQVAATTDSQAPQDAAAQPFARNDEAAVKAALQSNGHEVHDDMCIEWPSSFPRVVLIGGFAHDQGCSHEGMFVDRKFHATGGEVEALATRGFETAGIEEKEAIARAWIGEVVHAFGGGFVTQSSSAFELDDSPKFEPVHVRANKVGGVVVEGWVQDPSGMRFESSFRLVTYRFAPDGSISAESKRQFTVDGERLNAHERERAKPGG